MRSELDTQKIRQAGVDFATQTDNMYNALEEVSNLIQASSSYFSSPGADSTRAKFNASADKFEEFRSFLKTYSQFLEDFSSQVDKFDAAIEDAANDFPAM